MIQERPLKFYLALQCVCFFVYVCVRMCMCTCVCVGLGLRGAGLNGTVSLRFQVEAFFLLGPTYHAWLLNNITAASAIAWILFGIPTVRDEDWLEVARVYLIERW